MSRLLPFLLVLLAGTCFGQFISYPNSSPTTNSVTITYSTSTSANTKIWWGLTSTSLSKVTPLDLLVPSHSITVIGLQPATKYYYKVVAYDAMMQFVHSAVYNFTTLPIPIQHTVTLNWACGGTDCTPTYNVYRSNTSGANYVKLTSGIVPTTFADATVSSGSTVYYVVTATNATGESGYSNEIAVVIPYP